MKEEPKEIVNNDFLAMEAKEIENYKKELKKQRRKSNYSGSKLRKYYSETKRLKEEFNFSFQDISLWLRKYKRVKMTADGVRSAYNRISKEYDTPS